MRVFTFILLLGVSWQACADYVTLSNAVRAAENWMAEGHQICPASPIIGCSTITNENGSYHVVEVRGGRCLLMASDTTRSPVIAVVANVRGADGSLQANSPIWDMAEYASVTGMVHSKGGLRLSSSRRAWSSLLSGGRRLLTSSAPPSSPGQYILPGFEEGGVLTHWNQQADASAAGPLYNFYTRDAASGGPDQGGLQLSFDRNRGFFPSVFSRSDDAHVPCGCVATAFAALLQYEAVTGCVVNVTGAPLQISYPDAFWFSGDRWEHTSHTVSVNAIPVQKSFDWWKLPESLGGRMPIKGISMYDYWGSAMSSSCRDIIGAVAYNCGVLSSMEYGWDESAGYADLFVYRCADVAQGGAPLYRLAFPGLGSVLVNDSDRLVWSELAADDWIRAGHPLVLSVRGTAYPAGHCILAVGRDSDTGFTRVFMGWGGRTDGWVDLSSVFDFSGFSSIVAKRAVSDRESRAVPVYGRLVATDGPLGGAVVTFKSGGLTVGTALTDAQGYFRTLYKPVSSGSVAEELWVAGTCISSRVRSITVATNRAGRVSVDFPWGEADAGLVSVTNIVPSVGFPILATTWGETDAVLAEKSKTFDPVFVYCGDGSSTIPVPQSICSLYMLTNSVAGSIPGEYAIIDTRKYRGRTLFSFGDHILAYGVSTNRVDIEEYVRKAKERLEMDFRR